MPDIDVRLANKLDSAGAFTGAAWFGACVVGADSPSIADSMPTAGPLRFPRLCAFLFSRAEIAEAAEMANSAFPCPERYADR